MDDRGKEPSALYVRLDRGSWRLARTPTVGFGSAVLAPYEWPGALPPAASTAQTDAPSLPVPASLLPRLAAPQTTSAFPGSPRTAATQQAAEAAH